MAREEGPPRAAIAAVIPVYDEEPIVMRLCERVGEALSAIDDRYVILLVDDGSSDGTWRKIIDAHARDPRVKALSFERNFGQHRAIFAGLEAVQAQWVVVMDGDLQDDPGSVQSLYDQARRGYDVVFAVRSSRHESPAYLVAQRLFYLTLNAVSGLSLDPAVANFSILSARALDRLRASEEPSRYYAAAVMRLGLPTATIEVPQRPRDGGTTSYTFRKRLVMASDVVLGHSRPRLGSSAALVGGLAAVIGFAARGVSRGSTRRRAAAGLTYGGLLLSGLGVGLTLARRRRERRGAPACRVRERLGFDEEPAASDEVSR